jgi:hypothetical protein
LIFCSAASVSLESQPKSLASFGNTSIVGTLKQELVVIQGEKKVKTISLDFVPSALAFSADGSELAVGGEVYLIIRKHEIFRTQKFVCMLFQVQI